MMKQLLFATLLCLFGLTANAQLVSGPPVASRTGLPDLVVKEIAFEPTPDRIRVRVVNQGGTAAASCHLALMSMLAENASLETKKRVWTIPIPELQPGKSFENTIVVSPLKQSQGPWKALVDRSNKVKESNESNNQLTYGFGGSVLVAMPDLQIAGADLVDATTGEVNVEIFNSGSAAARASQLRLIVWEMQKFEKKSTKEVFVRVPSMGPTKRIYVKVKAGVPIISTRYSLYIDIGEAVKESNENNNRFEGEAGKS